MHDGVRLAELENGLRCAVVEMPWSRAVHVEVRVRGGSAFETDANAGAHHMLEHALFLGSNRHPTSATLAAALDDISDSSAETGVEALEFSFAAAPEACEDLIDLVGELLLTPTFPEAELSRERRIVLRELAGVTSDVGAVLDGSELMARALYPGHALARPTVGSGQGIRNVTAGDLRELCARHFCASNMVVSLAGDVDTEHVTAALESAFGSVARGERLVPIAFSPPTAAAPGVHVADGWSHHAEVHVGLRAPDSANDAALAVALMLLDDEGSAGRRLYRCLRDAGLAYHLGASLHAYRAIRGAGHVELYASPEPKFVSRVMRALVGEVEQLAARGPTPEELVRVRSKVGRTRAAIETDAESMADWYADELLQGDEVEGPGTYAERASAVTADEVAAACGRLLDRAGVAVVVQGELAGDQARELRAAVSAWRPPIRAAAE